MTKAQKQYLAALATLILIPLLISYSDVLKPMLSDLIYGAQPSYIVLNPIINLDSTLVITAENNSAESDEPLIIEFDDIVNFDVAVLSKTDPYTWEIDLNQLDRRLINDGRHKLRAGFKFEKLSPMCTIYIDTKIPKVQSTVDGNSTVKKINVVGLTENHDYFDTLKAEVSFFHNGETQKINVPIIKIVEQGSGEIYFEFETTLQGFPNYSKNDPEYTEPFFGFNILDQAGNQYYQIQSYAEFIAPGQKNFGVSNVANIQYDLNIDNFNYLTTTFKIKPSGKAYNKLPNGEPAIVLQVLSTLEKPDERELRWNSKIKETRPVTLIYRDDKQIGASYDNKYIDYIPGEVEVEYRVEQIGVDDKKFTSNMVKSISEKRIQYDSLIKENRELENIITQKEKERDSLITSNEDYNKPLRKRSFLPSTAKGYMQKDLSVYADLIYPDTLTNGSPCTILLNFFDPDISEKATPIHLSINREYTIFQSQTYELKQFNKIRFVPRLRKEGVYKLEIGVFFNDGLTSEHPFLYRMTKTVQININ